MQHLDIDLVLLAGSACFGAEPALRWSAPIAVPQNAAVVTLLPPASA